MTPRVSLGRCEDPSHILSICLGVTGGVKLGISGGHASPGLHAAGMSLRKAPGRCWESQEKGEKKACRSRGGQKLWAHREGLKLKCLCIRKSCGAGRAAAGEGSIPRGFAQGRLGYCAGCLCGKPSAAGQSLHHMEKGLPF